MTYLDPTAGPWVLPQHRSSCAAGTHTSQHYQITVSSGKALGAAEMAAAARAQFRLKSLVPSRCEVAATSSPAAYRHTRIELVVGQQK